MCSAQGHSVDMAAQAQGRHVAFGPQPCEKTATLWVGRIVGVKSNAKASVGQYLCKGFQSLTLVSARNGVVAYEALGQFN